MGYQKEYKSSDNNISDYLKCVFDLLFLKPKRRLIFFIDDLMTIKPVNTTVDKFFDYLLKAYIEQDALFPSNIWTEFAQQPQITPQIVVKVFMQDQMLVSVQLTLTFLFY